MFTYNIYIDQRVASIAVLVRCHLDRYEQMFVVEAVVGGWC